jgi:hypothetical protein
VSGCRPRRSAQAAVPQAELHVAVQVSGLCGAACGDVEQERAWRRVRGFEYRVQAVGFRV